LWRRIARSVITSGYIVTPLWRSISWTLRCCSFRAAVLPCRWCVSRPIFGDPWRGRGRWCLISPWWWHRPFTARIRSVVILRRCCRPSWWIFNTWSRRHWLRPVRSRIRLIFFNIRPEYRSLTSL
jgi:hypothetical protein